MKKVLSLIIICIFLILLVACSNSKGNTTNTYAPSSTVDTEPTTTALTEKPTNSPHEETKTSNQTINQDTDIEPFIEIRDNPGGFYLKKGESLLTFDYRVFKNNKTETRLSLTESDNNNVHLIYCKKSRYIPTFQSGDSIIAYSGSNVPKLILYTDASFEGYTICAYKYRFGGSSAFSMYEGSKEKANVRTDNYDVKIEDKNGNAVENRYNLNQGEEYTVFWYEGTKYNEIIMKADYPCYIIPKENKYEIEGKLTKNGYAEYDISSVPSGIYGVETSTGNISGLLCIE